MAVEVVLSPTKTKSSPLRKNTHVIPVRDVKR
jgi:hypothetical protein